jgi:predicted dehydrogenase
MWRSNESDSKGAMTAMGVHLLDFFVHLCGPVKSVSTLGSRRAMPVAINDVVRVNLEFENGATGYLSTMLTTPRQWRVQVYGTSGWTHMRDEQVMDVCDAKGIVTTTDFGLTDTLRMELESFADAVEGVGQYPVSGFELVHVPAVLEAVLQSSANSGVPVHIPAVSPDLENSP